MKKVDRLRTGPPAWSLLVLGSDRWEKRHNIVGSSCHVLGLHVQTWSTQHGTRESRLHPYSTVCQGMEVSGRVTGCIYLDVLKLLRMPWDGDGGGLY